MKHDHSAESDAQSGKILCPTCNYTKSHVAQEYVVKLIFPAHPSIYECERCGCQWMPAYRRIRVAIFTVTSLALSFSALLLLRVLCPTKPNEVRTDFGSNVCLSLIIVIFLTGVSGLLSAFTLISSPKLRIMRSAIKPWKMDTTIEKQIAPEISEETYE